MLFCCAVQYCDEEDALRRRIIPSYPPLLGFHVQGAQSALSANLHTGMPLILGIIQRITR